MPKVYSYSRFSTPEQSKGDSVRRQAEAARKYASEVGIPYEDVIDLGVDEGRSAFRGEQLAPDAVLGKFLALVEEGKIESGSVLAVEEIDRLSRQGFEVMHPIISKLTAKGIKIHTIKDGHTYEGKTDKNSKFSDILTLLLKSETARDESEKKAYRVADAYRKKRLRAAKGEVKMTSLCPAWLEMREDERQYNVIPGRREIIRKIIALFIAGHGANSIAKLLNKQNVKPWGKGKNQGKQWNISYIKKIRTNRALIGEFQPHQIIDGKRIPAGEPIRGYFPQIVSLADFHKINAGKRRGVAFSGRKSADAFNLFPGLTKCAECGATASAFTKNKSKGEIYFRCVRYKCKNSKTGWRYSLFEKEFIREFPNAVRAAFKVEKKATRKIDEIRDDLATHENAFAKIRRRLDSEPDNDDLMDLYVSRGKTISDIKKSLQNEVEREEVAVKDVSIADMLVHLGDAAQRPKIILYLRNHITVIRMNTRAKIAWVDWKNGYKSMVVDDPTDHE